MTRRNLAKNSLILATWSLLVITALAMGCKKKEASVTPKPVAVVAKPVTQQPKPVQKPVSSALRLSPPEINQFDFSSKKDPFKPYFNLKATTNTSQDGEQKALREALPIHRYDVGQFKLIGIITGDKGNRAMVTDPSGKGYVLKTGMTIGKNDGKITAITSGGVDVLEQFKDDNGRVRKEHIRITLPRKY